MNLETFIIANAKVTPIHDVPPILTFGHQDRNSRLVHLRNRTSILMNYKQFWLAIVYYEYLTYSEYSSKQMRNCI